MLATIKFGKIKEDAIIPSKREEDAGLDIYPCFDEPFITIPSHTTAKISTGICSAFDSDYVIILKERGSTGTKGIGQRSGVIDSGFRGEWLVPITNHNDCPIYIVKAESEALLKSKIIYAKQTYPQGVYEEGIIIPYEKAICQALVVPVPLLDIEEWTAEEIKAIPSLRQEGMLGSSGK